jgi:MFS family permease
MSTDDAKKSALSFLPFRLFLAMRLPGALAVQMQSVAVGWQVYDITHRPLALGLVGLAQFLPILGFSLIAGHVADRFDRRRILLACYGLQFLCSTALAALALLGARQVAPIYAALVIFGVARAFSAPATQAVLPNLVPRAHLGSAFAWNSSGYQSMTIAGPAIGGFIYALGASAAYLASGMLFLIATVAALGLRPPPVDSKAGGIARDSVFAGIAFIRRRREILGAISLDLFAVLFGGATALLPIYARDILDVGPLGLGLLRSGPALGAVAVGLLLAHRSLGKSAGDAMFAGVAIFAIATIVFGLSTNFLLSLAALVVLGAADMVSVFVRHNLIQRATPDAMRGRVNAVSFLFIGASNELGELESGVTADWFGAVPAVLLGGFASLTVLVLWFWRFPELRAVDRLEEIEAR